ncbi:hypothetical protein [Deinococcus soli (ex Cha et al. 2016)]|uniref:hypothetical protein n=1 Tax=Deinococcus soli (ex Cha et al. 2016) TaxID=1309411 RepID=UPI00166EE81E|nr:hypothetical protein [Deinococcus soli (ex Cha et al. 2016)]
MRRVIQQVSVAPLLLGGQCLTISHDLHAQSGRQWPTVHFERSPDDAVYVTLDAFARDLLPALEACAAQQPDHPPTLPLRFGFALRTRANGAGLDVLGDELTAAAAVTLAHLPALQEALHEERTVPLGAGLLRSWPAQDRYQIRPDEGLNLELDAGGYAALLSYLRPLLADQTP